VSKHLARDRQRMISSRSLAAITSTSAGLCVRDRRGDGRAQAARRIDQERARVGERTRSSWCSARTTASNRTITPSRQVSAATRTDVSAAHAFARVSSTTADPPRASGRVRLAPLAIGIRVASLHTSADRAPAPRTRASSRHRRAQHDDQADRGNQQTRADHTTRVRRFGGPSACRARRSGRACWATASPDRDRARAAARAATAAAASTRSKRLRAFATCRAQFVDARPTNAAGPSTPPTARRSTRLVRRGRHARVPLLRCHVRRRAEDRAGQSVPRASSACATHTRFARRASGSVTSSGSVGGGVRLGARRSRSPRSGPCDCAARCAA